MVSHKFMEKLPNVEVWHANATLLSACGEGRARIRQQACIYFRVGSGNKGPVKRGWFWIVPDLNFDVYLGQSFIQSDEVICLDARNLYLSNGGYFRQENLREMLSKNENISRSEISYLTRDAYSNSMLQRAEGSP